MFEQTQKDFIKNLLDENPIIQKKEVIDLLLKSGLSTSKTKKQSYNRALVEVLKERNIPISRENKTKPTTIIQTQNGISKISDDEFARDDFIDREIIDDDGIWYKKILKTGRTADPKFKTTLKIEIYTFEKNDNCRFDSLLQGVIDKVPEISYIDDGGYSSSRDNSGENSAYQFESGHLVVESGQGTYFYNGSVELDDTNEAPC